MNSVDEVLDTCIWIVKSKRMHEIYRNTPYHINLFMYLILVCLVSVTVSDCDFSYFSIF